MYDAPVVAGILDLIGTHGRPCRLGPFAHRSAAQREAAHGGRGPPVVRPHPATSLHNRVSLAPAQLLRCDDLYQGSKNPVLQTPEHRTARI